MKTARRIAGSVEAGHFCAVLAAMKAQAVGLCFAAAGYDGDYFGGYAGFLVFLRRK